VWDRLQESLKIIELSLDQMGDLAIFLIVVREYLKDNEQLKSDFDKVDELCKSSGYGPDWIYQHGEQYKAMIGVVGGYITNNEQLNQAISTKWIPEPPVSLWAAIEGKVQQECLDRPMEVLTAKIYPYLVVMREFFKANPDFQDDLSSVASLCAELEIHSDWPILNADQFKRYEQEVKRSLREDDILRKYFVQVEAGEIFDSGFRG